MILKFYWIFVLLLTSLIATNVLVASEQTIILKSGEKLICQIESLTPEKASVLFKGNTITINTSEISSIHYDAIKGESSENLAGIVKGTVTYYFNSNFGYKPDTGAKVTVVPKEEVSPEQASTLFNFQKASLQRQIVVLGGAAGSAGIESLKKLGADTQKGFMKLDEKAALQKMQLEVNKKKISATADGSGAYSIKVKPGKYYVLIVSSHSEGSGVMEVMGRCTFQEVEIASAGETSVDARFR